jgi:hypothetical protein
MCQFHLTVIIHSDRTNVKREFELNKRRNYRWLFQVGRSTPPGRKHRSALASGTKIATLQRAASVQGLLTHYTSLSPGVGVGASAGLAALAALGVVAMANSRPYEGAVTTAGAAVVLLIWRRRTRRPFKDLMVWRVAAPALAILVCGLAAMLYYNYRVTGDPLLEPYAVNQAQYGAAPIFWIMPPQQPPVYRREIIRRFWTIYDMSFYVNARAWPPLEAIFFVRTLWYFFLTAVSALALIAAVLLRHSRKVRMALVMGAFATVGIWLERFPNAHYFAPPRGWCCCW